nr:MAG TPA: hypothetical protein [Caudoviricetes sp.]
MLYLNDASESNNYLLNYLTLTSVVFEFCWEKGKHKIWMI